MRTTESFWNACARKIRYLTRTDAARAAAAINARSKTQRHRLEAYHCRACDGWHVGRSRPRNSHRPAS
jgi:hypothetical protein